MEDTSSSSYPSSPLSLSGLVVQLQFTLSHLQFQLPTISICSFLSSSDHGQRLLLITFNPLIYCNLWTANPVTYDRVSVYLFWCCLQLLVDRFARYPCSGEPKSVDWIKSQTHSFASLRSRRVLGVQRFKNWSLEIPLFSFGIRNSPVPKWAINNQLIRSETL